MEGSLLGAAAAAGLFLLFQCCGAAVAWAALPGESGGVRLLLGSVCGTVMLQWFPVPFAFLLGFTLAAHGCAAGLALLCAGLCLWAGRRKGLPPLRPAQALLAFRRRKGLWLVLGLWLFACWLVCRSFRWEEGAVYSRQATYGDMSMHLSFITSLARQGDFPPDYSLLPGHPLCYPFLGDSVSASLLLCGAPLTFSYALPMWFAMGQVMAAFLLFAARLLESWGKGTVAFALFFFNGGAGFLYFLGGDWENFTRMFTQFYETPTNLVEENVRWVNVLVDMMLPQRALLFGWAVLFPALYLLYRGVFQGKGDYFWKAGVLAGLLPMIHTHSFLALALVCGAWLVNSLWQARGREEPAAFFGKVLAVSGLCLMGAGKTVLHALGREDGPVFLGVAAAGLGLWAVLALGLSGGELLRGRGRRLLSTWGLLLLITCALALPQLFLWTFRQANGFVRGHFAWVTGEDSYLWFYLKNLGLSGVLALGGMLLAKPRDALKFSPALGIWFLAELVEFQPNDYDNNKLFYVAWAFLSCAAAWALWEALSRLRSNKVRALAGGGALAVCALSAGLTMGREAVASYQLFSEEAVDLARFAQEELDPKAVVVTDARHNNELAALAGQNLLCGSPIYLHYHGLDYTRNQAAAQAILEDPAGSLDLLAEYGVDYVLAGPYERGSFLVEEGALEELFPKVYDDGTQALYQVNGKEDGT